MYGLDRDDPSRIYQRIPLDMRNLLVLVRDFPKKIKFIKFNFKSFQGASDHDPSSHPWLQLRRLFPRADAVEAVPATPSAIVRYSDPK